MATLLEIKHLSKSHFRQPLFTDASVTITERQKIGVIGRNGAGKTTLFRIIMGEDQPDSGEVHIHDRARLGYLEQHDTPDRTISVIAHLEAVSGKPRWECAKMGAKFDLNAEQLELPLGALSGGYQMRVKLATLLLGEPNIFLLDEPTNYLDIHTQLLLEEALRAYNGAFLIISHDREFLNRTCTETLEVEHGQLRLYPGTITAYFEHKRAELHMKERYNEKIEKQQAHLQKFVDRFRYKASKASQAQSKLKALEKLKTVEIDDPLARVRIFIPPVEVRKGVAFSCHQLAIGYGEKIVASEIRFDVDRGAKVVIVGDNGHGKTTFLKTLVGELNPLAGTFYWGHGADIAYYAQHIPSQMPLNLSAWEYLERQAGLTLPKQVVLHMAGNFLFDQVALDKKIDILSGGERARLCLAGLLLAGKNTLVLDEPTNHLDFETVEALGRALAEWPGTVFFISHNRTFVAGLATVVVEAHHGHIIRHADSYEYYLQNLASRLPQITPTAMVEDTVAAAKKSLENSREHERALKKKLHGIEEDIAELVTERNRLLGRQARRPEKFSSEEYTELGSIMRRIELAEAEWLAAAEALKTI